MPDDPVHLFVSAAHSFAELVRSIPENAWDGPGLGDWDLRSLVGHTSRSLITTSTYIHQPAQVEDVTSAHEYYAMVRAVSAQLGSADIVERGRSAGAELGANPADAVDTLVATATAAVRGAEDRLITVIGGRGMRLYPYLTTRVFELAVHSLDIARATGLAYDPPSEVLEDAAVLATRIAVLVGAGTTVLAALTGRSPLPQSFSVV
ncbi:maleylpyruvate isomerase N-terminal domain-containing protein [Nocardia stercoris]|uniref:Mycothiol maleylpyruvate isomerase n=1 Tax=Nocardia stercoris TaxID=2483361 RepID=A0A3M2L784_9NOCA|nr:maleylpyruvate isomerase N-terminal domain-containing protein [Nocardia stercoris]RMI33499.1 mycothiol maleylpyruvate isomerase [Nocardia stercoris]